MNDYLWVATVTIYKLGNIIVWRRNQVYNVKPSQADAETFVNTQLREYLKIETVFSDDLELRFVHRKIRINKLYDFEEQLG